jgi:hypothetical protein
MKTSAGRVAGAVVCILLGICVATVGHSAAPSANGSVANAPEVKNKDVSTDASSIPQEVNYQGRLTDDAGNPITGTRDMTFAIYDAEIGGTQFWSESQTGVQITDGLFNVILGSLTPISNIPGGPDCYLEISIAGAPVTPRIQLVSVLYALKADAAKDAEELGGIPRTMLRSRCRLGISQTTQ